MSIIFLQDECLKHTLMLHTYSTLVITASDSLVFTWRQCFINAITHSQLSHSWVTVSQHLL